MKYRPFGASGLEVSEIGFGCGRNGGLLVTGEEADARGAVRRALDGGINWFDTAEAYGSEPMLGRLLAEVDEDPYVSTKVTIDPAAGNWADQVVAHGEAGLARLGRESVTVLQLHNRIDPFEEGRGFSAEQALGPGGPIEGLERLRDAGKTRLIGFTALGDAPSILAVIESGRLDSAQVFYNLVNPSAARAMMPARWTGQNLNGVMDACAARGMGMLGIRVLVGGIVPGGRYAERVSMMTKETDKDTETRKADAAMAALGEAYGSRAQTALRFALACDKLSLALVGIGEPGHVDAALAAEAGGPLPGEALDRLERLYESDFA